jgi:hypothetical protein
MPKRMVPDRAFDGALGIAVLPAWQAVGLSVAVIGSQLFSGSGVLVFALFSVGVIWSLHRLRAHSPDSASTADLIASAPGAAPARVVNVLQFVAYVTLGAYAAKTIASMALVWLTYFGRIAPDWWGPAIAVAVVGIVAVLVGALPTRLLATVATVLAAFGLLVFFYIALAVIARMASGTAPIELITKFGASAAATEWGPAAMVVSLAIVLAGFEIPTAVSDRLSSVARPLGWAIVLVAVCATTAWVATNMATTGDFNFDAIDLVQVAIQMFGETGANFVIGAEIAGAVAALLVLVWGATRVIRPSATFSVVPLAVTAVVTALLTLAMAAGWFDAAAKLWGVAGLLLVAVYLLAAQANSRLDDSSTTAWAWFALTAIVLAVAAFLMGAAYGWWPVAIAVVVVALAFASAATSLRQSGKPNSLTTP